MSTYSLPNFDDLNVNSLEEFYDTEILFDGMEVEVDLNFEFETIDLVKLDIVKNFIINVKRYNSLAINAIRDDFELGDTVSEYIEHHLEELSGVNLAQVTDESNKKLSKEEQLLSQFYLKRIGFYPDNEEQFAIFDYTINEELTDYLIVVHFSEDGEIDYLTMES